MSKKNSKDELTIIMNRKNRLYIKDLIDLDRNDDDWRKLIGHLEYTSLKCEE